MQGSKPDVNTHFCAPLPSGEFCVGKNSNRHISITNAGPEKLIGLLQMSEARF